jgi:hypothetical protein
LGVYHIMGLGRSVGAVTAALSYLAARFERDDESDRDFFQGSGEVDQPLDQKRGDVQALIFVTTPEIHNHIRGAEPFYLNQPGRTGGQMITDWTVPQAIGKLLLEPLRILTQTSRDPEDPRRRRLVEIYWCEIERDRPTLTFERIARTLVAAKPQGKLGKEVWINYTGGTNIINSALQLSVSLLGVSARLYYILTDHTDNVYHTVPAARLGRDDDRFWVDLPVIYMTFDEHHRCILRTLAEFDGETLSARDLYDMIVDDYNFGKPPGETKKERLDWFRKMYLLPLRSQELISRDESEIRLGPGWNRLKRFYEAIPDPSQHTPTLADLAKSKSWLFQEELTL